MKTLQWLSIPILASTACIAAVMMVGHRSEAATGDPIVVLATNEVTLTPAQRTCYRNWVQSTLTLAAPSSVTKLECATTNSKTECSVVEMRTVTAAQFVTDEAAGRLQSLPDALSISADGSMVTTTRQADERLLNTAQATALDACNNGAFGSANVRVLRLRRSGTAWFASAEVVQSVTPVQRLLQIRNGITAKRIGTVE